MTVAAFGKEAQSNTLCQLVLASSSPRRQELVASLDLSLPVRILSTDADESIEPAWTPAEVVERLAHRKAEAAVERLRAEHTDKPSLVVGADTIVVLDGEVLGKPVDREDAIATLQRLQGRNHEVYTGVACIHSEDGTALVKHRRTHVWMKPLSKERIERYVATGEPMDKAGSYGIQGLGAANVDRIEGCYFNVVGLPLSLLSDMLEVFGIDVY
ncbi:septum formation protein [Paenibacillus cellulosilyticus]|uniref:dTTP/UTP pyrophosphatase n=1 Tax=Paenibacillus cellulosilyticus TaxID=375489 RepID=A0A2V2YIZ8_9BACL|nr:Maf family protein [Paenibacillus cellulosilyticus]PWV91954.1 septum formation protein [Paenibacillus cellulosilyticus]QKS46687.1 septum formation inhibitor Maf [Paenibacillus cellulosilyticus]